MLPMRMSACVVLGSTAILASSVQGGDIDPASLEYSSVLAVNWQSSGTGGWFTSPGDFDSAFVDFQDQYTSNTAGDISFHWESSHDEGSRADRFRISGSTENGWWVPNGATADQTVTINSGAGGGMETVYLRYAGYSYSESGVAAPELKLTINGAFFGSLGLDEELAVQAGDQIEMKFSWGDEVFPDVDMAPGFTMDGFVEIYESTAVVPGPVSLAILGFGGFMRRRRHRG